MKKWMLVLLIGILFTLAGCGESPPSKLSGSKPPETDIQIGTKTYPTKLGTYCWSSGNEGVCVDTAGPEALLEGKDPIVVQPGEEITFVMDYDPMPNEVHVAYYSGDKETKVKLENYRFTAPEENVSNGDAFYAFALEVK